MRPAPRPAQIVLAVLVLLLVGAAPASADHHLLRVNEVMLSTGGNANAQFVELLDPNDEPFPSTNAPYKIVVYDGGGDKVGETAIPNQLLMDRDNTQPLLISTPAADSALGVQGDVALGVALPSPGQLCYTRTSAESRVDCISWGCVTKRVDPGAPRVGPPPDGQSVQRQGLTANAKYENAQPTPKAANIAGASATACPNPTPNDSDGDGVPDASDQCPSQPANTANGCPAATPTDSDGDGVPNETDPEPNNPSVPGPFGATNSNDTLNGGAQADTICGLFGSDTINGLGANDTLFGDACNKKAKLSGAQSTTDGNDKLNGGDGNDTLYGAGGKDTLKGGKGKDKLSGGDGNDTLSGDDGKDSLDGGKGDDKLTGGKDVNSYKGGDGKDTLNARNGKKETVDCGAGKKDSASVDRADTVKGCETVSRPRK